MPVWVKAGAAGGSAPVFSSAIDGGEARQAAASSVAAAVQIRPQEDKAPPNRGPRRSIGPARRLGPLTIPDTAQTAQGAIQAMFIINEFTVWQQGLWSIFLRSFRGFAPCPVPPWNSCPGEVFHASLIYIQC
jgi:hypothetical protein